VLLVFIPLTLDYKKIGGRWKGKKRVLKHSTASYVQAVLRNTVVNSLHKKAFKLKRKKNSLKLWYMGQKNISRL
jgi:hypothetical protein